MGGGTPSGSRALATSLCGRRLGCGTSPRVKWGGGTVLGMTSRVRGDSLRLAETRLVLDINLVIFFEKCAKNRKKCEILARRGTTWHVVARRGTFFSGEGAPSPICFVYSVTVTVTQHSRPLYTTLNDVSPGLERTLLTS